VLSPDLLRWGAVSLTSLWASYSSGRTQSAVCGLWLREWAQGFGLLSRGTKEGAPTNADGCMPLRCARSRRHRTKCRNGKDYKEGALWFNEEGLKNWLQAQDRRIRQRRERLAEARWPG
jgi:hypothetical protein